MTGMPDFENFNIEAMPAVLEGDYRLSRAIESFGEISRIAELSKELAGKFAGTVDAAETAAILQACGSNVRCEALMIILFEKGGGWYETAGWKELVQKLVAHGSAKYVDFYLKYAKRSEYGVNRDLGKRFDEIKRFAFAQIVQHADVAEMERLLNCLLAFEPAADNIDELNILAQANWNDGRINPLLKLKQEQPHRLYQAIAGWWDSQIALCVDNDRHEAWTAALRRARVPSCPMSSVIWRDMVEISCCFPSATWLACMPRLRGIFRKKSQATPVATTSRPLCPWPNYGIP